MLHANFEVGYYVVDGSDNVGAGPFKTPDGAEDHITNWDDETVMYFDGLTWDAVESYRDEDDGMSDAEADADTLRMAGWGTDEDYGGDWQEEAFYENMERDEPDAEY